MAREAVPAPANGGLRRRSLRAHRYGAQVARGSLPVVVKRAGGPPVAGAESPLSSCVSSLILAVSGGVDSVLMLDQLAGQAAVVAHFNHGMRGADSEADERFVRGLAAAYGLPCVVGSAALGPAASEATARAARWAWLESLRCPEQKIATAHHLDDLVGSILINLQRGTGWRGLAVLGRAGVERPLLGWTKAEIYAAALERRLEWVEDGSNQDRRYLRNRLRGAVEELPREVKQQLFVLRQQQVVKKALFEGEISQTLADSPLFSREILQKCEISLGRELLRVWLEAQGVRVTRPTLERLLGAAERYPVGKLFNLPGNRWVRLERDNLRLLS